MASKQYYAVNEIRHGEPDGGMTVFAPGQQVSGLPKEAMVALWEAGVLEERDPSARPADDRDARIVELEKELAAMRAEKEAEMTEPVEEPVEGTEEEAAEGTDVGGMGTPPAPEAPVEE
jgi:hypothetical protein